MNQKWTAADIPSLTGRTAVVTGANSGLGLETAAALAAAGATVVMACRTPARADAALTEIRDRRPRAQAEVMSLDLADLASVRAFATRFRKKHPRLDLLVNNAGVMAVPLLRTRDGFEMQIGTNHLGHFALTGELFKALSDAGSKGAPARIVNVSSMAHNWTRGIGFDDLNYERRTYYKWLAYGQSKLANLVFTFELERRLAKAGVPVIVAAAHPGYASTNLQFVGPAMEGSALQRAAMGLSNKLFGQSAAMGALPSLYAATAPDVKSGEYFGPDGFQQLHGHPVRVGCRAAARDPDDGARLWELSQKLTGARYL